MAEHFAPKVGRSDWKCNLEWENCSRLGTMNYIHSNRSVVAGPTNATGIKLEREHYQQ